MVVERLRHSPPLPPVSHRLGRLEAARVARLATPTNWTSGAQGIKASNSSWEGDFPRYGSSFRKVRVGYSIPCWSARWPCTPESPLPIEPAGIHPGFLVRHPFKSPFTPISQIAEGQPFEIWEYYLIFRRGWLGGWLLSAYVTALLCPRFPPHR